MPALRPALALIGLGVAAGACQRPSGDAPGASSAAPPVASTSAGAALGEAAASRPAAPDGSGAAPVAPSPTAGGRPWGPVPLGSPAAFDLIQTERGPLVLWGGREGEVRAQPLDAAGAALGAATPWSAATPGARALELAAAADGPTVVALWVEERSGGARTRAGVVSGAGEAALVSDVGGGLAGGGSSRGALALARTGVARFEALFRSGAGRCAGGGELAGASPGCVGFGAVELTATGVRPHGLPLSVPDVCDPALAGFAHRGDQWHYGVCSRQEGRPALTLFSRQPEPQYARAERVLDGCVPVGVGMLGEGAFFVGQCGVLRRAVRVDRADRPPVAVEGTPTLACQRGAPEVAYAQHGERLEAPRDGLAALLPPALAPRNARAVWTGEALLVAVALGTELHLRRYQCVNEALVPTGAL